MWKKKGKGKDKKEKGEFTSQGMLVAAQLETLGH